MTSRADDREWPSYYPAGVPPDEAKDAAGCAFRIVKTIPPAAADFRSSFEEYTEKGTPIPANKLVQAYGTSLHTDITGSRETRNRFRPLRNRRIATGILVSAHGKMMETGGIHPSHITVWFRLRAQPELAFLDDAEASAP
jgi:hypothetical protein